MFLITHLFISHLFYLFYFYFVRIGTQSKQKTLSERHYPLVYYNQVCKIQHAIALFRLSSDCRFCQEASSAKVPQVKKSALGLHLASGIHSLSIVLTDFISFPSKVVSQVFAKNFQHRDKICSFSPAF